MKLWLGALAVSIFLSGATAFGQNNGSIRGSVVDEKNVPVGKAKVNASAMNGQPTTSFVRYVHTDAQGYFLIDRLEWGKYGVFAMKEEAGYPDSGVSLYSNDVFPTITISPAAPAGEVQIHLGPKAGILTGVVTNVRNGAPLSAGFKLSRAASPDKWLSTSLPPNYRLLVPSSTDVLLEVSAPGFRTWTFRNPLRLTAGTEMRLDMSLEPLHDPNLHPSKLLVPDGYVGWLLLDYNVEDAEPVPIEAGAEVFKFPPTGTLSTSSPGPQRGAEDEYFYYSPDGSLRGIPADYRNGKGMIWGHYEGTRKGVLAQFGFFVGSEEQYKKYQSRTTHPGSISTP